ncbi:MAG: succinate dehydrogenase/fumarate reductase iron-sulfur subunit [Candidatus Thorarchaeota archaeon]|jgi:succinate dehydrogenase / fumarate reductase iron-sulfur subunit
MMFRVARSREGSEITHYDLYKVDLRKGMTVLDVLFQIQDHMDESLAFRYSCRGAVCGSCAMLVNKIPVLACRTQVNSLKKTPSKLKPFEALTDHPTGWNPEIEVLVEPLPNLPILKDLVVDMVQFYDALESLRLWADPAKGDDPRVQSPTDRKKIERYVNCIMCALCFGSCPINAEKEEYLGPAAVAKAWRFSEDSRTEKSKKYLEAAKAPEGSPLCELIYNCVKVCPKGVAPGGAIRKIKES